MDCKGAQGNIWGDENTLSAMTVLTLPDYIFQHSSNCTLKFCKFILCKIYLNKTDWKNSHAGLRRRAEHAQLEDAGGSWEALSQHYLNPAAAAARERLCFNALTSDRDTHWPFPIKVPITHSHLATHP